MINTFPTNMTLPVEREIQATVQLRSSPHLNAAHYRDILCQQALVQSIKTLATYRVIPDLKNLRVFRSSR